MKHPGYLLFMAILFLFPYSSMISQNDGDKKNVAVIELESTGGLSQSEIRTVTDRFRSLLVRTNAFKVVDRGRMQEILEEQGFQMTGCTSNECAVEAGMILGVEQMVTGTIGRLGKLYTMDVILIDVESSEIIKSLSRDYTGEIEGLVTELNILANELADTKIKASDMAFGSIKIETDPAGAEILIDDRLFGKTPLTIPNLIIGSHALKLVKPGFVDYVTEINIAKNQTRQLATELQKAMVLSIRSNPDQSDVYINGQKAGVSPFRGYFQDGAKLTVALKKTNYKTWSETIIMDDHQTLSENLEFTDAYAKQIGGQKADEGGSNTWLWIGAGAVAVGAAAFFLIPQNDDGGTTGQTGFPEPPTR